MTADDTLGVRRSMLTKKQHELLLFIHSHLNANGVSPSFDEMKDALALKSKSGIHRLITGLEERGFIRRLPHRARAVEVLRLPNDMAPADATAATTTSRETAGEADITAWVGQYTVPAADVCVPAAATTIQAGTCSGSATNGHETITVPTFTSGDSTSITVTTAGAPSARTTATSRAWPGRRARRRP